MIAVRTCRFCHITATPSGTSPSILRQNRFTAYPSGPVMGALGTRGVLDMVAPPCHRQSPYDTGDAAFVTAGRPRFRRASNGPAEAGASLAGLWRGSYAIEKVRQHQSRARRLIPPTRAVVATARRTFHHGRSFVSAGRCVWTQPRHPDRLGGPSSLTVRTRPGLGVRELPNRGP